MHTIGLCDALHNGPQCDTIIQGAMGLKPGAMTSDQALKFRAAAEIGKPDGLNRACYFGTSGGGFGEVSGAYRLVLFIQLEVAHKHFRLARPTQSAQRGGCRTEHVKSAAD